MTSPEARLEARWEGYLRDHRDRHLEELMHLLSIPSISALPEHRKDVRQAALWMRDHLQQLGFPRAEVWETAGHPSVYAEWIVSPAHPTVLIYGHLDVQPVDPLEQWQRPPFEPAIEDGILYARGACDDKGCLFIPVKAVEALAATGGQLPLNVKFLLEGEEEIGSPNLPQLLESRKGMLQADLVLCADGGFHRPGEPSLTLGSRGLCGLEVEVQGPRSDLHSGAYGGAIRNPLQALCALLATLHTPEGRVAVEGFYDDVQELPPAESEALARVAVDEATFLEETGAPATFGEPGYSIAERLWTRPTLEINGLSGGFQGEGVKTVLPAVAKAKITCRLVPHQRPEQVLASVERHLQRHAPAGVRVTLRPFPGSALPYVVDAQHPVVQTCRDVLRDIYGTEPVDVRTGGTLPVAGVVSSVLQVPFVFFSFGDPDTQIHAPNEFFRLDSFDKGVRAYARLLQALPEVLSR